MPKKENYRQQPSVSSARVFLLLIGFGAIVFLMGQFVVQLTLVTIFQVILSVLVLASVLTIVITYIVYGTPTQAGLDNINGVVLIVTDAPAKYRYVPILYIADITYEAIKAFGEYNIYPLRHLHDDLINMLILHKNEHRAEDNRVLAAVGDMVTLEDGNLYISINIPAETAALLDIHPTPVSYPEKFALKVREKYGKGVQGILCTVKSRSPKHYYTPYILFFPWVRYNREEIRRNFRIYDDLVGQLSDFFMGEEYVDGLTVLGKIHEGPHEFLKIELTEELARVFGIDQKQTPYHVQLQNYLQVHYPGTRAIVVKVTNVPPYEKFKDEVYALDTDASDAMTAAGLDELANPFNVDSYEIDSMDTDLIELLLAGGDSLVKIQGVEMKYGLFPMLIVTIDYTVSGNYSIYSEDADIAAIIPETIRAAYGADVQAIVLEITDESLQHELCPVVIPFDHEVLRELEETRSDIYDFNHFDDGLDENLVNMLLGRGLLEYATNLGVEVFEGVKVLRYRISKVNAEAKYGIEYSAINPRIVLTRNFRKLYGDDIHGFVVRVTGNIFIRRFPTQVYLFANTPQGFVDKLGALDGVVTRTLETLDMDFNNALIANLTDRLTILSGEEFVPGLKLVAVEVPANYASFFGLRYTELTTKAALMDYFNATFHLLPDGVLVEVIAPPKDFGEVLKTGDYVPTTLFLFEGESAANIVQVRELDLHYITQINRDLVLCMLGATTKSGNVSTPELTTFGKLSVVKVQIAEENARMFGISRIK